MVSSESFPPINMPTGIMNSQFSITLNWQISDENVDLLDEIRVSAEWISLLEYGSRSGTNGKRQITSNTVTVTFTDPTTTQHTFTELQPFSHYCFTITALYVFEGQTLGETATEPFCTNTSEAGK